MKHIWTDEQPERPGQNRAIQRPPHHRSSGEADVEGPAGRHGDRVHVDRLADRRRRDRVDALGRQQGRQCPEQRLAGDDLNGPHDFAGFLRAIQQWVARCF